MGKGYREVYEGWKSDPEGFWRTAAEAVEWVEPPRRVFDADMGVYGRWFPDAVCNTCHNAVDRHARDTPDRKALIHVSPVTDTTRTITYGELLSMVNAMAAVLADEGVEKGDRVVVYMPMIPETVVVMLACARLGAVHSVVFGGFAAHELATRIDDCSPKLIVTASCGIEPGRIVPYKPLVDEAKRQAACDPATLVLQRPQVEAALDKAGDKDLGALHEAALAAGRTVPCTPVAATDPLYILYTSGTTGTPKGVVRDNGGHMVALAWTMENLYGVAPGETFFTASDVGWVVGHSYIVYGPLIRGATSIVFEGKPVGTPDAGIYWRTIAEHGVVALFTAPTALRAIKKEDPKGAFAKATAMPSFRTLFLAGERADPDSVNWAADLLGVPVIDHWWQTETGWAIAGNPVGLERLPVKVGSPTVPMPGYDMAVLSDAGEPLGPGELGNLAVRLPLPPGNLPTLWGNEPRFRAGYLERFPGYYNTSDAGYVDEDGYLFIMSRTDDIINVAGHRLSTGAMEEVLSGHPDVAECAVIGIADELKGQVPCGFVVLKAGVDRPPEAVERELVARVREEIGPVAAFKLVVTVARLPKTRSGKILRKTMRQIVDREAVQAPATIEDPACLEEIAEVVASRHIGAAGRVGA